MIKEMWKLAADLQSMNLDESILRTVENRTITEEGKQAFLKFFLSL